jgi:hypothetical protein
LFLLLYDSIFPNRKNSCISLKHGVSWHIHSANYNSNRGSLKLSTQLCLCYYLRKVYQRMTEKHTKDNYIVDRRNDEKLEPDEIKIQD